MEDKNFLTKRKQPAIKTLPLPEVLKATRKKEDEPRARQRERKRAEVLDGTAFKEGGRLYHTTKAALIKREREKEQQHQTSGLLKRTKKSDVSDDEV